MEFGWIFSVALTCESTLVVLTEAAEDIGVAAIVVEMVGAVDVSVVVVSIFIKSNVPSGVEPGLLTLDDSGSRRGLLLGGVLFNITIA